MHIFFFKFLIEDFTSTYYNSFDRLQNVANCFCISMALWYILCTKFSSLCKFLRQFAAKKFTPQELAGGEVRMIRKQIQESMIAPPPQKIMNMKTSSPMIHILKFSSTSQVLQVAWLLCLRLSVTVYWETCRKQKNNRKLGKFWLGISSS